VNPSPSHSFFLNGPGRRATDYNKKVEGSGSDNTTKQHEVGLGHQHAKLAGWIETSTRHNTHRLQNAQNIPDNESPSHTIHPELSLSSTTQGTSSSDSTKRVAHGQTKNDDAYKPNTNTEGGRSCVPSLPSLNTPHVRQL
jgi:hypothetical protein